MWPWRCAVGLDWPTAGQLPRRSLCSVAWQAAYIVTIAERNDSTALKHCYNRVVATTQDYQHVMVILPFSRVAYLVPRDETSISQICDTEHSCTFSESQSGCCGSVQRR